MGFFDRLFKKNKEKENTKVAEIAIEEICEENNEPKVEDLPLENKKEEEVENKLVEIVQAIEENKEEPKEVKKGFFSSLKEKLFKSREGLFGTLKSFILGRNVIDDEMYEELEDILVQSDIGMNMTVKIVEALEKEVKKRGIRDPKEVYPVLKEVMAGFLITEGNDIKIEDGKLNVILVVGVNGVGKTTTIGKLAYQFKKAGKSVYLGAADTFRAAAVEQLMIWGERVGVPVVKQKMGADPASVAYDTLSSAVANNADIVIIDTAGRLHNKVGLMNELTKIKNVMKKVVPDAPDEVLLVLDGSTGQNAFEQAKQFTLATEVTAMAITKLDGTAKGGVVIGISDQFKIPVKYIGLGEGMEDLQVFRKNEFVDSLFGENA